jgi:hypothetical protein
MGSAKFKNGKMMKTVFISVAILFMSCSNSKNANDNSNNNMLSKSETDQGWQLLFDGKSLNGWRTYQNKPSGSWSVKDGSLYCEGSTTNKSDLRADLITTQQYENFELSIDWKISPKGNSGIMYRVTEEFPAAYLSGPEYQLIDDVNFPEKLENWQKTGANYAMDAAPTASPHPAGEWNHTRIIVNGARVEHWLNDRKIVEYELWTDEWKRKKMEGKWKDAAGYGMARKGFIALQDHGSEAWFRNVKLRVL